MTIRSRGAILGMFLLYTSIGFIVTFFLSVTFKTFLFQDLFAQVYDFSLINFFNLLTVYTAFYILWDVLMLLVFVTFFNMLFAKILNLQLGKVVIITALCLTFGVFGFHLIMYLWFSFGDPLGMEGNMSLDYVLNLFMAYDTDFDNYSGDLSDLLAYKGVLFLFDLISANFYLTFQNDPSLMNYLLMYLLMKGMTSNVPFQVAGLPFNPFKYEVWFMFGLYLILFIPLFYVFIRGCECLTQEELDALDVKRQQEIFGKEERKVLGETIIKTETSKTSVSTLPIKPRKSKNIR